MTPTKLRVAIIGAGPAGLAAAIEFAKLSFVEVRIYEQARELREMGAGIGLSPNAWRMLDALGVYENLDKKDLFRPADGHLVQHRNGRTGELLLSHKQEGIPARYYQARTMRPVLQKALLQGVDGSRLRLSSRLLGIVEKPAGGWRLRFEDGFEDEVDLLVGADGIRSIVRRFVYPNYRLRYTGTTAYRALADTTDILSIPGFPDANTFWHGPYDRLYTCNLRNNVYELAARVRLTEDAAPVSWGQVASVEEVSERFKTFSPMLQRALAKIKVVKKYALFNGPRLPRVASHGSIALVGDASHPLAGEFGTGAGCAFEDAYVLARAVQWAYDRGYPIRDGLDLFDQVRRPHYHAMFDIVDGFAQSQISRQKITDFDDAALQILADEWSGGHHWLYTYQVEDVWRRAWKAEDGRRSQTTGVEDGDHDGSENGSHL
ncbi:FAD/NAD(P)-binding domain-containing protein [Aspergillus saccharolyticus JOP 1030-1]|uniref:FAD/NAD(P)-binding domain-containing protein n=1 Tax=Aspergillus saccharolyticus JOP 1030-1 TaxID=1450539 RepID=A0A318ZNG2_9EURO|nr:FAD/NAD(P)-binding domain-containing protein [Aspergillus saccharolyticus JOP 1030-1]PYH48054.1 FAD/NAD(P)-binding domain-containing protein [Aspergillus saccharolyticus JOP 1030-1]